MTRDQSTVRARSRGIMDKISNALLILSVVQFFFTPPGIAIGLFFSLLITASVCGEAGMSMAEQDRLLETRKKMDRYGASY